MKVLLKESIYCFICFVKSMYKNNYRISNKDLFASIPCRSSPACLVSDWTALCFIWSSHYNLVLLPCVICSDSKSNVPPQKITTTMPNKQRWVYKEKQSNHFCSFSQCGNVPIVLPDQNQVLFRQQGTWHSLKHYMYPINMNHAKVNEQLKLQLWTIYNSASDEMSHNWEMQCWHDDGDDIYTRKQEFVCVKTDWWFSLFHSRALMAWVSVYFFFFKYWIRENIHVFSNYLFNVKQKKQKHPFAAVENSQRSSAWTVAAGDEL